MLFLYFLYIYILFRQERKILITFHFGKNSSFFPKNGTKFERKESSRLNSCLFCRRIGNPREAKSIQLSSYARTSSACCSSFSKIKTLERGFFFFFFTKHGFTLTLYLNPIGNSLLRMIQIHPTFELCANNTLTLLNSFSNRSCCFLYLSASAKLLLLPCSLCRRPPRAFSRISCKSEIERMLIRWKKWSRSFVNFMLFSLSKIVWLCNIRRIRFTEIYIYIT